MPLAKSLDLSELLFHPLQDEDGVDKGSEVWLQTRVTAKSFESTSTHLRNSDSLVLGCDLDVRSLNLTRVRGEQWGLGQFM